MKVVVMVEEKMCKNCNNYKKLYFKDTDFQDLGSGICLIERGNHLTDESDACEKWEVDKIQHLKEHYREVLLETAQTLEEIADIIQNL